MAQASAAASTVAAMTLDDNAASSSKAEKEEKKVKGLEEEDEKKTKDGPDLETIKDDPNRPEITLIATKDDVFKYKVSFLEACMSKLCSTALLGDKTQTEIQLPSVRPYILKLVVDWLKHHKGVSPPLVEKPLRSKIMRDVVSDKWDAVFIDAVGDGDRQTLYDLILAANYLDIKSLLHLGCAKVASLIKGQPLEKIKDVLNPAKNISADGLKKIDAEIAKADNDTALAAASGSAAGSSNSGAAASSNKGAAAAASNQQAAMIE